MSNGDVRNMSLGRRELVSLVASLMALMALGIDILLPAFDDIRVAFGLAEDSSAPGQLITVYFIGLAVANFYTVLAPASVPLLAYIPQRFPAVI